MGLRVAYYLAGVDVELSSLAGAVVYGAAIISAAFVISWTAEAAEKDISQALAIAFVALIAVLPEYSVDVVLAWKAGANPSGEFVHYAAANMTGANRLLVGLGWPLVFVLYWFKSRGELSLDKSVSMELVPLGAATILSFFIFLNGKIELWHSAVLLAIFVVYIWMVSRAEVEEPELIGPSQAIGSLSKRRRQVALVILFVFSALAILVSAEPFVLSLLGTGRSLGVNEFVMVQWVAPIASEAPELLVASIFALRGHALWAMIALISSKVNQWTLLVASLPITYSISFGSAANLPLDGRQMEEFLLTSAQSLFAVVLLLKLRLKSVAAAILFLLFITQLFLTQTSVRYIYSFVYLGLAFLLLVKDRGRIEQIRVLLSDFVLRFRKTPADDGPA